MALLVQKFGGSSLRDADHIRSVCDRIARTVRSGHQVVVTVSAMGDETNQLLALAPTVSSVLPGRELDMLITTGERKAAALVCLGLEELGIPTKGLTGSQAGIRTDGDHTQARILDIQPGRIRQALEGGFVPVVSGAQGISDGEDETFLGRGGTDTTAVALAHALRAQVCELYTDVPGVCSADPRIVPEARVLPRLSFDQMLEMCAAGCPKPAMRAVELARERGVVLHVRSAEAGTAGTQVDGDGPGPDQPVLAVIAAPGMEYELDANLARVSLVGPEVGSDSGLQRRIARALAQQEIGGQPVLRSQMRLSWAVATDQVLRAVAALHHAAYGEGAPALVGRADHSRPRQRRGTPHIPPVTQRHDGD